MKRHIAIILAAIMLLMMIPLTASAAKPELSVTINPTELVGSGDVTVSVDIYNPNEESIEECMLIIDGEDVKEFGNIPAGETATYTGKYSVSANKLGKSIPVQFTYNGGTVKSSFTVGKKNPTVKVNTTVKLDSTTVTKGEKSTFTFAIENNGDAAMENINLTASPLNGGKVLTSTFDLAAGKVTMVTYSEALTEDATIKPQISFTVGGKEYTKTMNEVSVKVMNPEMKVTISVADNQVEADKEFSVEVYIENSGNSNFKSVELFDMNDQRIPTDKSALAANEFLSATKTMKLSESGEIGFYVKATDSNGNSYTFNSNVIKMYVNEKKPDDYGEFLMLKVEPEQTTLDKKGPVKFIVEIANTADVDFSNITVTEKTLGEINSFTTLKAGETNRSDFNTVEDIDKTTTFEFVLTAEDPDGNVVTVNSDPIEITVKGSGGGLSALLIVIIIIILLIIGVGVTLLIVLKKDKDKKAKEAAQKRTAAVQGIHTAADGAEEVTAVRRAPASTVQRAKIKPAETEEEPPRDLNAFGEDDIEDEIVDDIEEDIPEETEQEPVTPPRRIRHIDFDDRNNF